MTPETTRSGEAHEHFVQFYKADEPMLNRNVGQFLWEGLLRGDGLLVIATPERRESLAGQLARLGTDVCRAEKEHQLLMLDARETLDLFLVNGQPDWECFQMGINRALATLKPRDVSANVRAYGEMVGVLWEQGAHSAAVRLEEYWNRLLSSRRISLFCGYPIDVFGNDFELSQLHEVLGAHSHVMPTSPNGDLTEAVQHAMTGILHGNANELAASLSGTNASLEFPTLTGERAILWLRENAPESAEEILSRARQYLETVRPQQG